MIEKKTQVTKAMRHVEGKWALLSVGNRSAIGVLICLVALLPRILHLDVFTAPDEQLIWRASNEFSMALVQGDLADTMTLFYPGVTLMWIETLAATGKYLWNILAGSNSVAWATVLGADMSLAMLAEKRLVLGLVHVALIVVMWRWLDKLLGQRLALLAGLLIALDPFLLAESRVMRAEALNAEFISLTVVGLLIYINQMRRRFLLLSGVFAGLAMLTKMSSLFLAPFVAFVLVTYFCIKRYRQQLGRPFWQVLPVYVQWSVAAFTTFVGLWPAFWLQPIGTLQTLWAYVLRVGGEGFGGSGVFFLGQIQPDDPGPWFYPVALLFRVGPLVLPGILLFLLFLIGSRANLVRNSDKLWPSNVAINLGVLSAFVVSYIAFMSIVALKFDRYLLPVFPSLDVIAAVGMGCLWIYLARPAWLKNHVLGSVSPVLLVLVVQGLICLREHPYYYTYYNPLFGGTRSAVQYIRVGYTEGFDIVGRYIASLPDSERLRVASAKSRDLQYYFQGESIPLDNLDGRWIQADYVFIYISQLQRGKHDPEILEYLARREPKLVVRLGGVEYGKLYPGPAAQNYSSYKLEGRGTLYGYTLEASQLSAGQTLTTAVYFRNEGQLPSDRFYVRLIDSDAYVWAEAVVLPRPGFEDAFRTREAIVEGEATLPLPVGMPPGQYVLKMGYEDAQTGQPIGEFVLPADADDVSVTLPSVFPPLGDIHPPLPLNIVLQDELSLMGYGLDTDRVMPGDVIWLTLYWQALVDVSHDYVIGLQLLDETGAEVTYWLGRPVRSSYPTDQWQAQQVMQDPWQLIMPPDLPSGRYSLVLSVYDAPTAKLVATTVLQELWLTRDE